MAPATISTALLDKLALTERMIERRSIEIRKVHTLARAAHLYELALTTGSLPGDDPSWPALCNAAFDLFGCDELYEIAKDAAPADAEEGDLFAHGIRSIQSLALSTVFEVPTVSNPR